MRSLSGRYYLSNLLAKNYARNSTNPSNYLHVQHKNYFYFDRTCKGLFTDKNSAMSTFWSLFTAARIDLLIIIDLDFFSWRQTFHFASSISRNLGFPLADLFLLKNCLTSKKRETEKKNLCFEQRTSVRPDWLKMILFESVYLVLFDNSFGVVLFVDRWPSSYWLFL